MTISISGGVSGCVARVTVTNPDGTKQTTTEHTDSFSVGIHEGSVLIEHLPEAESGEASPADQD